MRELLMMAAAALLAGCATRGPIDMDCADLATTRLEPSQLVRDIQSGASSVGAQPPEAMPHAPGLLDGETQQRVRDEQNPMFVRMLGALGAPERGFVPAPQSGHLLLSGGGQWGAYGTGFLAHLHENGQLPHFSTVTGVSTGALQALFIGALGDDKVADDAKAEEALFAAMMRAYRPANEKEIVKRDSSKAFSIVTGSFASLSPLRGRLSSALCDDPVHPTVCPMIAHLARSRTGVFLGFVKASDGAFYISDINKIAQRAYIQDGTPGPVRLASAQRCIAGAAMASLAMPVFFQQVRVGPAQAGTLPSTYFDGGVRQSVFEAEVTQTMMRAVRAHRVDVIKAAARVTLQAQPDAVRTEQVQPQLARGSDVPPLYVVRNGPTRLLDGPTDKDRNNAKLNIIDAALRAEQILVNQLEVQSIADLRLADPFGPILLRTADGFDTAHNTPGDPTAMNALPNYRAGQQTEACEKKPADAMFLPPFMACIMRYGRAHAEGSAVPGKKAPPWITLRPLDPSQ